MREGKIDKVGEMRSGALGDIRGKEGRVGALRVIEE